jgi:ABC-type multidrug transport system fused ATPase/permease subunit
VLRQVDFTIPRNTSLGVVGTTGAGKTTVIDLAMALLEPSSGKVLVDGQDVFDGNQRRWRAGIGYVPQTIYLADTSVANNIAFGIDESAIDHDRLESAARMARIHDFIDRELPDRYGTVVGERGVRLSGGQRQRIGIARALYHQPQFLIFDEATSALDNQTEAAIVEAIQSLAHRVTMLIVAHRIGTIRDCDAILLMERGEILDRGTYDELYARNATFRALADA